ncbi:MAG: protein kinase, partial [Gemmatimonadetes bacterium]|nr:protein kinase [Gemmatimonadota bacterium]
MSSEQTPAALAALEPDYEILKEIGRGGTAVVYLARERATGYEVAIKLIRAKYLEDEEAIARFAREARFVAQLDHPNVVGVHAVLDLGAAGIALVMAHIEGRTLKQLIAEERPLLRDRVVRIMRDVATALAAAHALGIIHRDVKPENIFIDADDRALLADFGVARSMSGDSQLTMHGVAIGTPSYMAPEQIDGGELDGRADIYSLGLVSWEMFTGYRPWEGESLYAVLYHQRHHELPDVREMRQDVTDEIADVINGAIEKEPGARWQSMNQLIAALDGAAPSRHAKTHVPVSTDTVRFARPLTPAPSSPAVAPAPIRRSTSELSGENGATALPQITPANVMSYFAPGELDELPPPRRVQLSRKHVAVAAAGLIGLITLGLVATAVEGRSNATREAAAPQTTRSASAGDVGKVMRPAPQPVTRTDSVVRVAPAPDVSIPESLSVAAALSPNPRNPPSTTSSVAAGSAHAAIAAPDAPVAISLGTARPTAAPARPTVASPARARPTVTAPPPPPVRSTPAPTTMAAVSSPPA